MDLMAAGATPVHRLDPRAKVVTTTVFLLAVVSFPRHEMIRLLPYLLFPVWLAAVAGLGFGYVAKRLLVVSPFALFVAVWNPVFERTPLLAFGSWMISPGWLSFLSIMTRFVLTVSAALVLMATTGFQSVCLGMEKLGMPRALVVQLQFLYRYIFVLGEEAARLSRARSLRSFGGRGMGMKVYGQLIGSLLIRTLDRAQRVSTAMLCRGYDGEVRILRPLEFTAADALHIAGWTVFFLLMRFVDAPELLGSMITGGA